MSKLLEGKKGLILGVANKRSIAWAIAQSLSREGAELGFTYQGERLEENVRTLAETLPHSLIFPCNVTQEAEIESVFKKIEDAWGGLDFLIHCVAYAKGEDIEGSFVKTKKDTFLRFMRLVLKEYPYVFFSSRKFCSRLRIIGSRRIDH